MKGALNMGNQHINGANYVYAQWYSIGASIASSTAAKEILIKQGGWIYSRTPSQILSDIGAASASDYAKLSGATFTGAVTTPNLTVTKRAKLPTIVEYETDVTENYTINNNSMSGHYVQIADNVTVTIADGAVWSIG